MSQTHKELVEKAREAINEVFGDTTVAPSQNRDSLESLMATIRMNLDALDDDEPED